MFGIEILVGPTSQVRKEAAKLFENGYRPVGGAIPTGQECRERGSSVTVLEIMMTMRKG